MRFEEEMTIALTSPILVKVELLIKRQHSCTKMPQERGENANLVKMKLLRLIY